MIQSFLNKLRKYHLQVVLCLLGVILCLIAYVAIKGNNTPTESMLDTTLQPTVKFTNLNSDTVAQVEIKAASPEQLKEASEKIFKLTSANEKLIKEVSRLTIQLQVANLQNPITAVYDDTSRIGLVSCDSLKAMLPLMVKVPKRFSYHSDSITLAGIVKAGGVDITTIEVRDSLTARDVKLKTGFLNLGRKYTTQIHHSNPLFRTDSALVFTIERKPTFWHKTGKPAVAATLSAAVTYFIINSFKR